MWETFEWWALRFKQTMKQLRADMGKSRVLGVRQVMLELQSFSKETVRVMMATSFQSSMLWNAVPLSTYGNQNTIVLNIKEATTHSPLGAMQHQSLTVPWMVWQHLNLLDSIAGMESCGVNGPVSPLATYCWRDIT